MRNVECSDPFSLLLLRTITTPVIANSFSCPIVFVITVVSFCTDAASTDCSSFIAVAAATMTTSAASSIMAAATSVLSVQCSCYCFHNGCRCCFYYHCYCRISVWFYYIFAITEVCFYRNMLRLAHLPLVIQLCLWSSDYSVELKNKRSWVRIPHRMGIFLLQFADVCHGHERL